MKVSTGKKFEKSSYERTQEYLIFLKKSLTENNYKQKSSLFGMTPQKIYGIDNYKTSKKNLLNFGFLKLNDSGQRTWNNAFTLTENEIKDYMLYIGSLKGIPKKKNDVIIKTENVNDDAIVETENVNDGVSSNIIELTHEQKLERGRFLMENIKTNSRENSLKHVRKMLNIGARHALNNEINSFDEMFIDYDSDTGMEINLLDKLKIFSRINAFELGLIKPHTINEEGEYVETNNLSKTTKFVCNFIKDPNDINMFLFGENKIKISVNELSSLTIKYCTAKKNHKNKYNEFSEMFFEKLNTVNDENESNYVRETNPFIHEINLNDGILADAIENLTNAVNENNKKLDEIKSLLIEKVHMDSTMNSFVNAITKKGIGKNLVEMINIIDRSKETVNDKPKKKHEQTEDLLSK